MLTNTAPHGRWRHHAIHTLVLVAGLASCTSAAPSAGDDAHPGQAEDMAVPVDAADPLERVGDYLDGRVLDIAPRGSVSSNCDDLPYERLVDYLDGRVLDVPSEHLVCPLK